MLKALFLQLFFLFTFGILASQTIVTLQLPNPCSLTEVEENLLQETSFVFSAYPNPAQDKIIVEMTAPDKIDYVKIQLVSMNGSVVKSEKIFSANNSCVKPLNVSDLPPSIYILRLLRDGETSYKKIIIQ